MFTESEIIDSVRRLARRELEPAWNELGKPDRQLDQRLWAALAELGLTRMGLPDVHDGLPVPPEIQFEIYEALAFHAPAVAVALLLHLEAVTRLLNANPDLPPALRDSLAAARFAFVGPLIGRSPWRFGSTVAHRHALLPQMDWAVLEAFVDAGPTLVVAPAASLRMVAHSPTGLGAIPAGVVSVAQWSDVLVLGPPGQVATHVDGLLAAILTGIVGRVIDIASDYAASRFQGGALIKDHDAVRQMLGAMLTSHAAMRALGLAAVRAPTADGLAAAFASAHAHAACVDAIQCLGGSGYMEDCKVERFFRDVSAIEGMLIGSPASQRQAAARYVAQRQGVTP